MLGSQRVLFGRRIMFALGALFCIVSISGASGQSPEPSGEPSRAVTPAIGTPITFDRATIRTPLWSIGAPAAVANPDADPVVFGDGAVFVSERLGDGGTLTAIDEHGGKPRWSVALNATPAALADETLLVVTLEPGGLHVVALDSRTGRTRWSVSGNGVRLVRQLAIVSNGLHLEARDARTGVLRWSAPWNGYAPQTVRLIGSTLLLQTFESGATIVGVLYAYDVRDGRPLWIKGNANKIIGVDGDRTVTINATWGPNAYANYEPITIETIALHDGSIRATTTFAPDPERWSTSTDTNVHFAQDAATDGRALVFRIGPETVYRYTQVAERAAHRRLRWRALRGGSVSPALWCLTTSGDFTGYDVPFAIQSFARASDCRLGVTESQAPAVGHVGTIMAGK